MLCISILHHIVAFKVFDHDSDGKINNGDMFATMRLRVGTAMNNATLQLVVNDVMIRYTGSPTGLLSSDDFAKVILGTHKVTSQFHTFQPFSKISDTRSIYHQLHTFEPGHLSSI